MAGVQFDYQLGEIPIQLRCTDAWVLAEYDRLYSPFRTREPLVDPILLDIAEVHPPDVGWVVRSADQSYPVATAAGVLPELEAIINQCVIATRSQFVQFHAGVLSRNGAGVILPADSGTGKTSLSAALVSRGWQFLSDEFALIDPETTRVHAVPKALCVKPHGRRLLHGSPLAADTATVYTLRQKHKRCYVRPWLMGTQVIGSPCSVEWMFFLSRKPHVGAGLFEPSTSEAVVYIYRTGLNTLSNGHRGLQVAMDLVRGASTWQLNIGDLQETCDLIEAAVDGGPEVAQSLCRTIKVRERTAG